MMIVPCPHRQVQCTMEEKQFLSLAFEYKVVDEAILFAQYLTKTSRNDDSALSSPPPAVQNGGKATCE